MKGILTAGTDRQAAPAAATGDGGAAAHLRGPAALLTLVTDRDTGVEAAAELVTQEVAS